MTVIYTVNRLGGGHCEIACRNENRDLIAVITHPPKGKWFFHPAHTIFTGEKKFKTKRAAMEHARQLAEK